MADVSPPWATPERQADEIWWASQVDPQRFWAKVDQTGDCWPWLTTCDPWGYGRFVIVRTPKRRVWFAHRLAYTLAVGPVPIGLTLDHLCENPACCNPAHLEPVTIGENTRRRADRRGRTVSMKPAV